MTILSERIQNDFIQAVKSKDEITKLTLNGLKSQITIFQKSNGNRELTEDEIIKVLNSCIKQRKQSIESFKLAKREDLVQKETMEMTILESYLPKQMSDEEILEALSQILPSFTNEKNRNIVIGKTIGEFNKKFNGKADISKVRSIIESKLNQ